MIHKEGAEFREFAYEKTRSIKHERDFVKALRKEYLLWPDTLRGVLLIGLPQTGKVTGVFQALSDFPSDRIFFFSPESREEAVSKDEVLQMVAGKDFDLIFIDEYSWLRDSEDGRDHLAGYLAGKAQEGVKVILTGTDSAKIQGLLNTDFIHRAVQLNTTYFSYDEYCRLYDLKKDDHSMKAFLTEGGIFQNHACESYGSMKAYIKSALIENLGSYYPQYPQDLIEAAVYKIFYECICKSYTKNADKVPVYNDGKEKNPSMKTIWKPSASGRILR